MLSDNVTRPLEGLAAAHCIYSLQSDHQLSHGQCQRTELAKSEEVPRGLLSSCLCAGVSARPLLASLCASNFLTLVASYGLEGVLSGV